MYFDCPRLKARMLVSSCEDRRKESSGSNCAICKDCTSWATHTASDKLIPKESIEVQALETYHTPIPVRFNRYRDRVRKETMPRKVVK